GGMGYSVIPWLPYVQLTGDPHTVYTVHQYDPQRYTFQEVPAANCRYPGSCDLTGSGKSISFNRAWLKKTLAPVDKFVSDHGAPVAVTEFGVMRWEPGAAQFLADEMDAFEARGMN